MLTSMTVTSNDSQCIHSIMFLDMKLLHKLLMLEMIFSRNVDAMCETRALQNTFHKRLAKRSLQITTIM